MLESYHVALYLIRCSETGREQQARLGKQRKDLASVIAERWPEASVTTSPGRLVVDGPDGIAAALAQIPGLIDVSPCARVTRDEVVATAVARAGALADRSFCVRVRRRDAAADERSVDIAREVADAIVAATGARVDLKRPDVTIGVELRGDVAFVFAQSVTGIDRAGPSVPIALSGEPKFVADQMLGRLAARLRLLGYDTRTVFDIADSEVTRMAVTDGRVLLTRDGPLSRTLAVPVHYVVATKPQAQLAEVVRALGLAPDPAKLFTRCTLCNAPIERIDEADAPELPATVRGKGIDVFRCTSCAHLYWRGSHVERILEDLAVSLK
jgi:uncharacterized protein with PIN domain/tRNA(Ser,Leu) C12 N-acetylase TAN1